MRLGFITSNKGKVNELQDYLTVFGLELMQLAVPYPELQADSIEQVAEFGLEWILTRSEENDRTGPGIKLDNTLDLILLEDSGLFIHALNNFPGVYSKYIFTTIGYNGILELMKHETNRGAHFESCIALLDLHQNTDPTIHIKERIQRIRFFKGECSGAIVDAPRGTHGFGFDPIFSPTGNAKTFAEMDTKEKNMHSHRGKAVQKLIEFLGSTTSNPNP